AKGRAILKDGLTEIVQVPYISYEECEKQLHPYKKGSNHNEPTPNKNETGCTHSALSDKIQDMFTESNSTTLLHSELESNQRNQSHNEKINNGWYRLADTANKG